jgi:hypothetical protein
VHSSVFCGESVSSWPVERKSADSIDSVPEKAQQEPHLNALKQRRWNRETQRRWNRGVGIETLDQIR